MRILLAEDDASQADSIKTWLEMDGYSVDWVDRGDHAILALEQHQIELEEQQEHENAIY